MTYQQNALLVFNIKRLNFFVIIVIKRFVETVKVTKCNFISVIATIITFVPKYVNVLCFDKVFF